MQLLELKMWQFKQLPMQVYYLLVCYFNAKYFDTTFRMIWFFHSNSINPIMKTTNPPSTYPQKIYKTDEFVRTMESKHTWKC